MSDRPLIKSAAAPHAGHSIGTLARPAGSQRCGVALEQPHLTLCCTLATPGVAGDTRGLAIRAKRLAQGVARCPRLASRAVWLREC